MAPDELSRPILRQVAEVRPELPVGPIRPVIDGRVSSYFEWLHAGVYEVDGRQGAMHGGKQWVRRVLYGSDGESVYVRLDLLEAAELANVTLNIRSGDAVARVPLGAESFRDQTVEACRGAVIEMRLAKSQFARLSIEVEQDGILRQRLPGLGEFEPGAETPAVWGV